MKFDDLKKQIISAVRESMNTERMIYKDLIEEEPESKSEYTLCWKASIDGVARGAQGMLDVLDLSYNQKQKISTAIDKQKDEYKN